MAEKQGVKLVREIVRLGYPKYRLAKDLGIARQSLYSIFYGQFCDERHIPKLQSILFQLREEQKLDHFSN